MGVLNYSSLNYWSELLDVRKFVGVLNYYLIYGCPELLCSI